MLDAADAQVKSEAEARANDDVEELDEDDEFAEHDDNEECDFAEGEKLRSAHIVARKVEDLVGRCRSSTWEGTSNIADAPLELLNGPFLDLNPPYQREVVWSSKVSLPTIPSS